MAWLRKKVLQYVVHGKLRRDWVQVLIFGPVGTDPANLSEFRGETVCKVRVRNNFQIYSIGVTKERRTPFFVYC